MSEDLYVGIDGGQSHTEAVVADERGNILGRGRGGPSNHAERPGGRERLRRAITDSVGAALRAANKPTLDATEFAAAHCAMTGSADFKHEVIGAAMRARLLEVGHDAPGALAAAMGGGPGVVVIAGTGSVAYGETADGTSARVGGWGYLFGDEGSGFWVAKEGVRRAMRHADEMAAASTLGDAALKFFDRADLRSLEAAVYHEQISRDQLATFSAEVDRIAGAGDTVAREIIAEGARSLATLAVTTARKLGIPPAETRVARIGGMFRGARMRAEFEHAFGEMLPWAAIVEPRFDPAIGALLLAYRSAPIALTEELLTNLERQIAGV